MTTPRRSLIVAAACLIITGCGVTGLLRGGIYRQLDEDLTIVALTTSPRKYLNKTIVISVRYYKRADRPCPLGKGYVNIVIADRVSYYLFNKAWIKKDKAGILDSFKEMQTVVIKARVFKIDEAKDPNLLILEMAPE
jgi:hypothetical protein